MGMNTGQITVGNTPTLIVPAATRNYVALVSHGSTDVFIGGSGVSTTTGSLLTGTKGTPFNWQGSDALYGITASGTCVVGFNESV